MSEKKPSIADADPLGVLILIALIIFGGYLFENIQPKLKWNVNWKYAKDTISIEESISPFGSWRSGDKLIYSFDENEPIIIISGATEYRIARSEIKGTNYTRGWLWDELSVKTTSGTFDLHFYKDGKTNPYDEVKWLLNLLIKK